MLMRVYLNAKEAESTQEGQENISVRNTRTLRRRISFG